MHHFRTIEPEIKLTGRGFEIRLTNSVTGDQITISGSRAALMGAEQQDLTDGDFNSLGRYLASSLSDWEARGELEA